MEELERRDIEFVIKDPDLLMPRMYFGNQNILLS
jgi:hypothetical protein